MSRANFYLLGRPGIPEKSIKKTHDISRERFTSIDFSFTKFPALPRKIVG